MPLDIDFTPAARDRLLEDLTGIVSRAAAEVLRIRAGALDPRTKADQSPVTAADMASEAVILEGVARLIPGITVISEESVARAARPQAGESFVLVDPVDGTRELVAGRDEFTINVAIVVKGLPALGIVAAPARGIVWRAVQGGGAERLLLVPGAPASAASERRAIRPRLLDAKRVVAAVSRSHLDAQTKAFLDRLPGVETITSGSAVKFCLVAEGAADLYPRLGPTHEWDVAAGHAVLTAAGGIVQTPEGRPLTYSEHGGAFIIPGYVAWGDPTAAAKLGF